MKFFKNNTFGFRFGILLILVLGLGINAALAIKVGPAEFPEEAVAGTTTLKLRGAGLKRFLTIQVVSVGLYLPADIKASQVLSDCVKRLDVVYLQNIPKDELDRATIKGIKLNVSAQEFKDLQPKISAINEAYVDVRKGDRITVTYLPQRGLQVFVNGSLRATVAGADIAKAFFAIWLGDHPVDAKMKTILLGGKTNEDDT